jgi:hypothetical protein
MTGRRADGRLVEIAIFLAETWRGGDDGVDLLVGVIKAS